MNKSKTIRIATRASQLAMAQAGQVKAALLAGDPNLDAANIVLLPMATSGDGDQVTGIAQWGYKGLFTKEIEEALLERRADIAVHSMKDMPSLLPDGLMIAAMLEREDPRDALVSPHYPALDSIPQGAVIGCSSTRRSAILRTLRPDFDIIPFRGNVNTRLRKLEEGAAAATLLAVAGLKRLKLEGNITQILPVETMLPAVAQGAIGIECRIDDADMRARLESIAHPETMRTVAAERAVLCALDGSCKTPLSAYATLEKDRIHLRAWLIHPDGSALWRAECSGAAADPAALGKAAGDTLRQQAGNALAYIMT